MTHPLIDTHPRIGRAMFVARWEEDKTGDWPGQRFCEVLRHDYAKGTCSECGAFEQRHTIVDRLLVGVNSGSLRTTYRLHRSCEHPDVLSNYSRPW